MGVVTPGHPLMTGLTPFILAMIRTPADRLANARPEALARKYEIPTATAAFYLTTWSGR